MTEREVFIAALQKETHADREAYLDQACAGQPALREQVEGLLRLYENADSFLEQPAIKAADNPAMATTAAPAPAIDAPGAVIGPYKLLEQIGEGGFGVVYLAEQTEPVRRKVALKILKPGMDTRQIVARFEAERQALAIMDHPNIAKVFDGGSTEPAAQARVNAESLACAAGSGRPYFVMELVKGIPITEYCDQNHLTPRQRLELFIPVCQAVQHAHQKGIIHRDLKPSNVLVTRHDSVAVPKVIDFGVAKAFGQELTDKTLFTGIAQMIGTPLYMSPEQAGMSDLDVDTRSDIYSLGVLLYELLTGTTPFEKERFKKAAYDEIRRIIRKEEPPKPSTRLSNLGTPLAPRVEVDSRSESSTISLASISALRQTEPAKLTKLVKGELDWIVMKCLEKNRDRRYETASALAADVQRYLHGDPVQAGPPSPIYRLRKFVLRNKATVVGVVLISAALIGGAVGVAFGLTEAQKKHQVGTLLQDARVARDEAETSWDREKGAKQEVEESRNKLALVDYGRTIDLAYREWQANQIRRARELLDGTPTNFRGWEWQYVYRLCHADEATYQFGQPIALSDDGQRLVTREGPSDYRVYDLDNANSELKFTGASPIKMVPDRRFLVFDGASNTFVLRHPVTGRESPRMRLSLDDKNNLGAPFFSGDAHRVLGQSNPLGGVKIVDAETGKELLSVAPDKYGYPFPVAISPDGNRALINTALNGSHKYEIIRADTGKRLWPLEIWSVIRAAAFSRSNEFLAVLALPASEYVVRIWNAAEGGFYWDVPAPRDSTYLTFTPDDCLVIGAKSGAVSVWDVKRKELRATLQGHTGAIHLAGFPRNGKLVTGSHDGTIRVWDLLRSRPIWYIMQPRGDVLCMTYSPDGARIAMGGGDESARVWGVATLNQVQTLNGHHEYVRSISYRPDGQRVAVASDKQITIWDVASSRELSFIQPKSTMSERDYFTSVAYSPDGTRLLTCFGNIARVWNANTGQETMVLNGALVKAAAWSPDGSLIATASGGGPDLWIWDANTGERRLHLQHPSASDVCFSHDGQRLLSSSTGRPAAKVWDSKTGTELFSMGRTMNGANSAAFSPDGRRIAILGVNTALKIFDAINGIELLSISDVSGKLVQFSPDGRQIAVLGYGGGTAIFDATPVNKVFRPPDRDTRPAMK